ncbi:Hypothetical predicted protein [Paramuricea clavata]|uniref:Uncharacterized protein n=1 Tax=Paramuricea clavata TaxID=317549 RepID=A0A6S7JRY0_PARCT|nr:Hypothetical predicted protein [Paramuricea clavata]
MFNMVVILSDNRRVRGNQHEQAIFKGILSQLRTGETSLDDWRTLLTRQPSSVSNLDDFVNAIRLYYSNEEVGKFSYDHLRKLSTPIAEIHARHSSCDAKQISAQDMLGLHPVVLICKGARVMLTINLCMALDFLKKWTNLLIKLKLKTLIWKPKRLKVLRVLVNQYKPSAGTEYVQTIKPQESKANTTVAQDEPIIAYLHNLQLKQAKKTTCILR